MHVCEITYEVTRSGATLSGIMRAWGNGPDKAWFNAFDGLCRRFSRSGMSARWDLAERVVMLVEVSQCQD